MKTNILKFIAILLTITLVNAGCKKTEKDDDYYFVGYPCNNMEILKVFNDEPATVKKGKFYGHITDVFYFELVNQDYDFLLPNCPFVIPIDVPKQYQKEGMSVYISGNVTNCMPSIRPIKGKDYELNVMYVAIYIFELSSIKIRN